MCLITFIEKPCNLVLIPVLSQRFGWWVSSYKGDRGELMQGDLNSPMASTQSFPHTLSSHIHSQILTRTSYMKEKKYINICITKEYKGLRGVKYHLCQNPCGLSILCVFCMQNYQSLPSTKYISFSLKNIPTGNWDLRHWMMSLYTNFSLVNESLL